MEAHSKTAEKLKTFIDKIDEKVQALEAEIKSHTQNAKDCYIKELNEAKRKTKESQKEASENYQERLEALKISLAEFMQEARSLMETKWVPLNEKLQAAKQQARNSANRTEEKLEEIKDELEELLDITRVAIHNFKETFKEGNPS